MTNEHAWLLSLPHYLSEVIEIMKPYDDEKDYVGAEDDWKSALIPRRFYSVDINPCAYLHDYGYRKGGDDEDRFRVDAVFLADMMKVIELSEDTWPMMNWYRRHLARNMALDYFEAVRTFGKAHWNYVERKEVKEEIGMEKIKWIG